jgi:predicted amidophosphoribosyltransferase
MWDSLGVCSGCGRRDMPTDEIYCSRCGKENGKHWGIHYAEENERRDRERRRALMIKNTSEWLKKIWKMIFSF